MADSWKLVLKSGAITIAVILVIALIGCLGVVLFIRSTSLADCSWLGTAITYLDTNENGHFDVADSALPGVQVYMNDLHNHLYKMSRTLTDEHGTAHLELFIAGCPTVDLQVQTDVPDGYRPTSPTQLHAKKDFFGMLETGATYYFGFAKIP